MVGNLGASPLSALTVESRHILSSLLNTEKVLPVICPDQKTRHRDWRGLASLANITAEQAASINILSDKTSEVLNLWMRKNDGSANVAYLLQYLKWLDRYDIYDDLQELAIQDKLTVKQTQVVNNQNNQIAVIDNNDENIITIDDRRYGQPQYYDAYVLYSLEDKNFVDELLEKTRSNGLKLCTEEDLLPGHTTEVEPVARLISERCRHIILVLSPDFLTSPARKFYTSFAQADGINKKQLKIIPLIYRQCDPPTQLMYYHKLRYSPPGQKAPFDFWQKLIETLNPRIIPRITNSTYSGVKIAEVSATPSNGYTPIKASSYSERGENFLPLPSVPRATASLSDLNRLTDNMSHETKSLSNSSQTSDGKKKKSGIWKIYNSIMGKKTKKAIAVQCE